MSLNQNMKMLLVATALLFFCSLVRCGSVMETVQVHVNQSCEPYQTDCTFGCCPYAQATCCADGFECCEHGQTCIPVIGLCIGAVNNNGQVSLTSKKSTPLSSTVLTCPSGTTECKPDKCCLYEHAVCCSDGQHCCPNGYRCDVSHGKCIPNFDANEIDSSSYNVFAFNKPLRKLSGKSPYKSCPGRKRMCPSYMSCCVNDNDEWACCPNPSRPEIRYGGGDCCDTIFGHMCCPDDWPVCTIFGCTK